jgi:hypothetical protein
MPDRIGAAHQSGTTSPPGTHPDAAPVPAAGLPKAPANIVWRRQNKVGVVVRQSSDFVSMAPLWLPAFQTLFDHMRSVKNCVWINAHKTLFSSE